MRLAFEQAAERFGHIDGDIVAFRLDYPSSIEIDVRFYPWWEHPRYRAAISRGARWGFQGVDHVSRVTTVVASGLEVVHLSGMSATDVVFSDNHPLLWQHDPDRRTITINSDLDRTEFAQAVANRMQGPISTGLVAHVLGYLPDSGHTIRAPRSIGYFPRQLFPAVLGALEDMRVEVYREDPRWHERARRLLVELDETYVIANHISFDVPEFDHPPEVYTGE